MGPCLSFFFVLKARVSLRAALFLQSKLIELPMEASNGSVNMAFIVWIEGYIYPMKNPEDLKFSKVLSLHRLSLEMMPVYSVSVIVGVAILCRLG